MEEQAYISTYKHIQTPNHPLPPLPRHIRSHLDGFGSDFEEFVQGLYSIGVW